MKTTAFVFLILFTWSTFAIQKECVGQAEFVDAAGVVLLIDLQKEQIKVSSSSGGAFEGVYPSNGTAHASGDGKTYLQYEGLDDAYFNTIAVCADLLAPRTTGLLKIRSVGEGYLDAQFDCRDI